MLRCKNRVRLTIAGDGELRRHYEHLAASLTQQGRVRFVGRVPFQEMRELYRTSHVFLFTSLRDRFGTIVLEAMAQGLVVVSLDHCGVRSLIPSNSAIKIPLTDPDDSADAMAATLDRLASDDAYRLSVAAQAREFAAGQAWSDLAGRFVGHYRNAIESYDARHANRDL
jgi:glycosyltransferase involved in cell wall biosynthesis